MVNLTSVHLTFKHCFSTIRHSVSNSQLSKTADLNLHIYTDDSVDLVTNTVGIAIFVEERNAKLRCKITNGTSVCIQQN